MQTTVRNAIRFSGVGLHSGAPARMTIHPAGAHHGIWFRRTDLDGNTMIPARHDAVERSPLCTLLVNEAGVSVSTVEHVMAALSGCGVLNAVVDVDGPEVPILDGSAIEFVRAILATGVRRLDAPVHAIEVLRRVFVTDGSGSAELTPAAELEIDFSIEFPDAAIGRQHKVLRLSNGTFVRELCDSRTFCRQSDVDAMRAAGKALGGSYDNAVVVDGAKVLNPGGLRHADEAVRHKMLDAMGDLALAGAPILGRYTGLKAGHALTNKLLHALFSDPLAYRIRTLKTEECRILPGAGLERDRFAHV
ncbi:UDP-3-O-acyl-N-acetylglucosamine deacetylase [Jannaschia aquimarina]|uniref:UDP-3-O-acyl-N-acetylglucosamine deacetylase n=1 Tax=Jannaschia aquimarina TaxID=935700 RepID=A0A0D1D7B6_9RHOB|nr:UDP-3-O-acyl-N-acetylglucosamine deacetylase [Jannaschia aquimarina]KIT15828.1 UDP-3-O-[3-hydroxymyristoyl] N-acetylglucosamine deacetylase [Jannaschia aquimarina]SNT09533.1 UDP-3-O-[3-hydroxymyristoyl] N-acetylglucosamine deacetylase [Jannaschia aquimarina]